MGFYYAGFLYSGYDVAGFVFYIAPGIWNLIAVIRYLSDILYRFETIGE